jgi:hypothetical protein
LTARLSSIIACPHAPEERRSDIAAQQRLVGDEAGPGELAVRAAGVAYGLAGGDDTLVGEAARDAELHRQIVRPDQQRVDAGNGRDRVGIGDRGRGFQQHNDERGGIDVGDSLGKPDLGVSEMRQTSGDRPVAMGRIVQRLGNLLRLLRGIDMRHGDAKPATVKKPRRQPQLPRRHSRHWGDAGTERGKRDLHRGV